MPKHKAGKKFSKSHTTIIDAAIPIINQLEKQPEVTKIVLGIIKAGLRPAPQRTKITPIQNGLKLQIRGTNSVQTIFVYSIDASKIKQIIKNK